VFAGGISRYGEGRGDGCLGGGDHAVLDLDGFPAANAAVVCSPAASRRGSREGGSAISPYECARGRQVHGVCDGAERVLHGTGELHLGDDYNPVFTVQVAPLPPASVRGKVMGSHDDALAGASVWVVGWRAQLMLYVQLRISHDELYCQWYFERYETLTRVPKFDNLKKFAKHLG